ncbi:carbohydrate sulfotransferase 11-like [Strongylocentrotus purpuratus]|uniref:Carbohydrate sulfotransferase n=1 Tax=Strongylocentrotus purpuratus TaxID=7668 RepID=A0A7M7NGA3_STRPU|nr:carbohydrate sulfotransferase 11-like [Strongylocentrotus purpuratus]
MGIHTFISRKKMLAFISLLTVSLALFIIKGFSDNISYLRNRYEPSTMRNVPKNKNTKMPGSLSVEDIQHKRRSHLRETCERLGAKKYSEIVDRLDADTLKKAGNIFVLDKYKTIFCYVPKTGCTTWKRMLLLLNGNINATEDISHEAVHYMAFEHIPTLRTFNLKDAQERLTNYSKFVFVREPFSRILSAFRDKFEVNNPIKNHYAPRMVKKSKNSGKTKDKNINVTFGNFVDYVSDPWNVLGDPAEEHWREMFRLCSPCQVPYDYIGHFETFKEDFRDSMQQITKGDNIMIPEPSNPTNSSRSAIFDKYYSQLSSLQLESLYKRLATDIELFNYQVPASIENRMNTSYSIWDSTDEKKEHHE